MLAAFWQQTTAAWTAQVSSGSLGWTVLSYLAILSVAVIYWRPPKVASWSKYIDRRSAAAEQAKEQLLATLEEPRPPKSSRKSSNMSTSYASVLGDLTNTPKSGKTAASRRDRAQAAGTPLREGTKSALSTPKQARKFQEVSPGSIQQTASSISSVISQYRAVGVQTDHSCNSTLDTEGTSPPLFPSESSNDEDWFAPDYRLISTSSQAMSAGLPALPQTLAMRRAEETKRALPAALSLSNHQTASPRKADHRHHRRNSSISSNVPPTATLESARKQQAMRQLSAVPTPMSPDPSSSRTASTASSSRIASSSATSYNSSQEKGDLTTTSPKLNFKSTPKRGKGKWVPGMPRPTEDVPPMPNLPKDAGHLEDASYWTLDPRNSIGPDRSPNLAQQNSPMTNVADSGRGATSPESTSSAVFQEKEPASASSTGSNDFGLPSRPRSQASALSYAISSQSARQLHSSQPTFSMSQAMPDLARLQAALSHSTGSQQSQQHHFVKYQQYPNHQNYYLSPAQYNRNPSHSVSTGSLRAHQISALQQMQGIQEQNDLLNENLHKLSEHATDDAQHCSPLARLQNSLSGRVQAESLRASTNSLPSSGRTFAGHRSEADARPDHTSRQYRSNSIPYAHEVILTPNEQMMQHLMMKMEDKLRRQVVENERKTNELEIAAWRLSCLEFERANEREAEQKQRQDAICYFVEKAEAAEARLKALEERLGLDSSAAANDEHPPLDRDRSDSFGTSDAGLSVNGDRSFCSSPGSKSLSPLPGRSDLSIPPSAYLYSPHSLGIGSPPTGAYWNQNQYRQKNKNTNKSKRSFGSNNGRSLSPNPMSNYVDRASGRKSYRANSGNNFEEVEIIMRPEQPCPPASTSTSRRTSFSHQEEDIVGLGLDMRHRQLSQSQQSHIQLPQQDYIGSIPEQFKSVVQEVRAPEPPIAKEGSLSAPPHLEFNASFSRPMGRSMSS